MTREISPSMQLITELPILPAVKNISLGRSTSSVWRYRLITVFAGIVIIGTLIFLIKCIVDRFCSLPRASRRRKFLHEPSTQSPKPAEGTQTVDLVEAQKHLDEVQKAGGRVESSEGRATVTSEISFDDEG